MNERDFIYWLQGFFELRTPGPITEQQAAIIKEHLSLTLDKQTTLTMNWDSRFGLGPDMVDASC